MCQRETFSPLCLSLKLDGRSDGAVDSREKLLEFCFDYCYWSVDPADPHYASQEEVRPSAAAFPGVLVLVRRLFLRDANVCFLEAVYMKPVRTVLCYNHFIKIFLSVSCFLPSRGWRPTSCQPRFRPRVDINKHNLRTKKQAQRRQRFCTQTTTRRLCVACCVFLHRWPLRGYETSSICYPEVSLPQTWHD